MQIQVNGEAREVEAGSTVAALLDELGLDVVLLARVVEHREEEAHELLVAGVVLLGDEREVRLRAFRVLLESV